MIPFSDPRQEQDLATVLAKRVARSPEKPWIVTKHDSYSYGDINIRSGRMAHGFAEAGVKAGDTVLIMLPDTVDYIWAWCALSKLDAIEVPVNVHYRGSILYYVINDSGAKIIVAHTDYMENQGREQILDLRYMLDGKARYMGLGPFPDVSLSEARQAAAQCRKLRREGIDPIEQRHQRRKGARIEAANSMTFQYCAERYIDAHKAGWRNEKHTTQWSRTLETYAYPVFGG